MTFIDLDICQRTVHCAKIVICDHDLRFEGNKFENLMKDG